MVMLASIDISDVFQDIKLVKSDIIGISDEESKEQKDIFIVYRLIYDYPGTQQGLKLVNGEPVCLSVLLAWETKPGEDEKAG